MGQEKALRGGAVNQKNGWFAGIRNAKVDRTLVAVSLGHAVTDWFPNSLFLILPYLAADLRLSPKFPPVE